MTTFTTDVATVQAGLLANDYTLGVALESLCKFANRTDLFAAVRERDQAEAGRIFMELLHGELRHKAVQIVAEATEAEIAAECAELRRDWNNVFADCPRPLAPCELSGDGS